MGKLIYDNVIANIQGGIIDNIRSEVEGTYVNVLFENANTKEMDEIEVKVVKSTVILDERDNPAKRDDLFVGGEINVIVTSSLLHGYKAQMIHILKKAHVSKYAAGVIAEIDKRHQLVDIVCTEGLYHMMRFEITDKTLIKNQQGQKCTFDTLEVGMFIETHYDYANLSVPEQTSKVTTHSAKEPVQLPYATADDILLEI